MVVLLALALVAIANSSPGMAEDGPRVDPLPSTEAALIEATRNAVRVPMPESMAEGVPSQDLEGIARGEAEEVLEESFQPVLDEGSAQAYDELEVESFRSDHVALVSPADPLEEGPMGLLSSALPLRVENDSGEKQLIDLDLERIEGHFEPQNPLAAVEIPGELSEGVSFPGTGITLRLGGAEGQRASSLVDDASAFFPNVKEDSDLVVAPTATGVETYMQLRSSDAPNTHVFQLDAPSGVDLQATEEGGAEIVGAGGETFVAMPAPFALDANGGQVPVAMSVEGQSLRVVADPPPDAVYPILVDPIFERYDWSTGSLAGISEWSAWANAGFATALMDPQWGPNAKAEPGPTAPGNQATFQYYVPRYWADLGAGYEAPTSYIRNMKLWNVRFMMPQENAPYSPYPLMQMGIYSPNKQQFVSFGRRYGSEGQATDMNWVYDFTNPNEVTDAKLGMFAIATWDSWNQKFRYVNAQQASVEVADNDAPAFGELGSVSQWVRNQPGSAINYKVSDPGLGIYSLRIAYPAVSGGTGLTYTSSNCIGTAGSACPRSLSAATKAINYEPGLMAQGENWVGVQAWDPVNNWSSVGQSRIKVDRAQPGLDLLGGDLAEQATVGSWLPTYTVKYSSSDGDDATPVALSPIGSKGTGSGQLERPIGVAVDGAGNLLVADKVNNRVLKFTKNGDLVWQIGTAGPGNGQFNDPRGIALAPNGNIWVTDYGNKRIQAFTPQGAFIRQITFPVLQGPYPIAAAQDGTIWVSDVTSHQIYHFSENGALLGAAAGIPGGSIVEGLAIDSFGNLWATDRVSNKVYQFNSGGILKFSFGSQGTGNGQFNGLVGIAVAPTGNILVVDDGNNRIQEFKPDGSFLRAFGSAGSGSGQLTEPRHLAVGAGNTLLVADATNHRIARWSHADLHNESGVVKLQIKVDGVSKELRSPGCATKNCAISGQWDLKADEYTVGRHKVEAIATDGVGLTNTKTYEVDTHGDLTAPSIALSGSMTEQSTLGTTRPSYKLKVSATDPGPSEERKSGVASTTIKIDGTLVDSASPGCPVGSCSITREWTLNSGSYAPGAHIAEVKATDAAGRSTVKTLSFNIARDTTAPTFSNFDPFYTAPEGWLEQKSYRIQSLVSDNNGYGVTSVQLKVDGALVLSASQTCPAGGCSKTFGSEPPIDMNAYSGGAHPAELIASDGAGNVKKKSWMVRVSPEGTIGTAEAENTLEAVDDTADLNTVGAAQSEEGLGGTAPGLGLEEREFAAGEFEFISTGGAAVSTIDTDAEGGFSVSIPPEEAYEERCETNLSGEGQTLTGAQEEWLAQSPAPDCNSAPLGESVPAQVVEVKPITLSEAAKDPSLSETDSASVSSNFRQDVDLVTRPLFDGAMTFAAIREPVAAAEFSWRVNLESDQQLTLLDPQHAVVYYDGGIAAFSINAISAHDAIGTAVPTRLAVLGNILTLIVDHQKGDAAGKPFTYPVVGGAGWEGGFQTYAIAMPPPELPEEEAEEEGEGVIVGGNTFKGGRPLVKSMTTGPPMPQPLSAPGDGLLPGPQTLDRNVKKFKFTYCVPHNLPTDPAYDGGLFEDFFGVGTRKRSDGSTEVIGKNLPKIVSECHREDFEGVYWGVSVNGKFHYVENHWVWLFPKEWGCHKWGEEQPAKIHCKSILPEKPHGENGVEAVHGPISAVGEYRWPTMKGQWAAEARAACLTEGGKIYPNPRKNGTAPYERPMIWKTEYVIAGAESCDWM